jgi:predicted dehydrogenase
MVKVGIVGLGYWGPNLLRNFYNHQNVSCDMICDLDEEKIKKQLKQYPKIKKWTKDFTDVLREDLDLVVIATPPETHYELAKLAIEQGKNVLVEKPFTTSIKDAEELIELSKKKRVRIFVDHTFVFNPCVRKIKEIMQSGELGEIIYFDSERVRAPYRTGVDVIWDLAVHDFSILLYFGYDIEIRDVLATKLFGKHRNDIAHISFVADGSIVGHIYVNWFSPVKVRKMIIGGKKKVLWWDDVHQFEKIKIYENSDETFIRDENPFFPTYISGDIRIVKVDNKEPLSIEVDSIVKSILDDTDPEVSGEDGLKVVKLLVECENFIRQRSE